MRDMEARDQLTQDEVAALLADGNWGRWGPDDQRGAANLITPQTVLRAVRCVRSGESVGLSRPFPTLPNDGNPKPAEHFVKTFPRLDGGLAVDYYGIFYHGFNATHLDALCHVWDSRGLYNGGDPAASIARDGSAWGDVSQWRNGLVTRGVLLDVPRYRGTEYVDFDSPVTGSELEAVAQAQGVDFGPGDALLVHSGRERWSVEHGHLGATGQMPGWHASCLRFLKDHDIAVAAGDFTDSEPTQYPDIPWTVHGAIHAYGVAIIDNALLDELAERCAARQAWDFLFVVAPLRVAGGTGSPVTPLAVL
jgi:kynurenine formamidase